jgi:hypothetical protein
MLARLWVVTNGAVTDPNCIIDYGFEYIFDLFKGIHNFLKSWEAKILLFA